MAPVVAELEAVMAKIHVRPPSLAVLSGLTGEVMGGTRGVREGVARQTAGTVGWVMVGSRMVQLHKAGRFVEMGPGGVLSGLARQTFPQIPAQYETEKGVYSVANANVLAIGRWGRRKS